MNKNKKELLETITYLDSEQSKLISDIIRTFTNKPNNNTLNK